MVRRSSSLLSVAVATAAGLAVTGLVSRAYVAPTAATRRSLVLGGLAGAAATVKADSASATGFGFGETGNSKDDYAFSPYSLLGGSVNDPDNIYKEYGTERINRAREELTKTYETFKKLRPEIENKHYTKVKAKTTLQAGTARTNLNYLSAASGNEDILKLKSEITLQLDYLTVDNRQKKTADSLEDYDKLMPLLGKFLEVTSELKGREA
jgi:hypothetical protein